LNDVQVLRPQPVQHQMYPQPCKKASAYRGQLFVAGSAIPADEAIKNLAIKLFSNF